MRLLFALVARLLGRSGLERLPTTTLRLCFYIVTMNFRGWVLYVGLNRLESLFIVPAEQECWYRLFLKHPSCRARVFDFSDHVVLYMAQLLPVALMETLHSFVVPFWGNSRAPVFVLVSCLAYFYTITLIGQFKTAAYFHTGWEILAGYAISLSVQIPYVILQCYPIWEGLRLWFFGYPLVHGRHD